MKRIEAVFPPGRLDKAFDALQNEEIGGLTYFESKGRGQLPRPQLASSRGTSTFTPELDATSTGLAGEGKIFISEVDDAIDIGSKARGESAI